MYDALIIGAGITGSSIAMELSKYNIRVAWLDKHNDVSMETTRANSGIIHAGYDPECDTLMAKLNVEGSRLYKGLAERLNIHYKSIGSLVIGSTDEDLEVIENLYKRGLKNKVEGMEIIYRDRILELEPNIGDSIKYALYSPTAAIISPWEACLAFSYTAVENGVMLHLSEEVVAIEKMSGFYRVKTKKNSYDTLNIINAAGLYADEIYSMVSPGQRLIDIEPVKGEYFLLDKNEGELFNHIIFQTPTKSGKGVLVSKTVHGNLIVGPNASHDARDKRDVSNKASNLDFIRETSKKTSTKINFRDNIRNFTGLRATNLLSSDFIIGEDEANKGFINFAGIKSPGLSCAPAFGPLCKEILEKSGFILKPKNDFHYVALPKYFMDMEPNEVNELIKRDSRYGRIICRCERVTEGEIVNAIHAPIPARTIDAIKRRTNSGMGRCQGGFCGPKILEILMRELDLNEKEVNQDDDNSYVVATSLEDLR